MGVLATARLSPNRNGAQLWFTPTLLRDSLCPLVPGDDIVTQLVPHVGVLVLPAGAAPEYPITVPHPTRIDPTTDLSEIPLVLPEADDGA